jgi:hypothetical protein
MRFAVLAATLSTATVLFAVSSFAQSNAIPADSSWSFDNWALPATLPWTTYQATFIGIAPTQASASPFDSLFYNEVYKTLTGGTSTAAGGNCYGMSLMSLMIIRDGGHLGFCAPVSQYSGDFSGNTGPTNPALALAINIMHGHQVNLPSVEFILNIVANHNNQDAQYALQQFSYWQSRGDYTLVSVTKDLNPQDGGHTLVAYALGGSGNQNIMVYDPDRPWATTQSWYNSNQNFIQINGHSWSYTLAGSLGTWSGNPGSGGSLIITPVSVTGPDSPDPVSLGLPVGQLLATILLSGQGAAIEQITDDHGKRLFKPGTIEVDSDPITGMRNTVPIFRSDATQTKEAPTSQFFHFGTSGGALHITVNSGSAGYTLSSLSSGTILSITAHGGRGRDTVVMRYPTTREAGIVLENKRGTVTYDVQFARSEIPGQSVNVLAATSVLASSQGQLEFDLANRGQGLAIFARGAATRYDLELRNVTRLGQAVSTKKQIDQGADSTHTIQPNNWRDLQKGGISEQVKPIS